MNVSCSAEPCPVILNATCVFYQGGNLVYTGILTNDNLQTALEKIDKKFKDAGLGYIFNNGLIQTVPGNPVQLGGSLIQNTIITNNGFNLTFTENLIAGAHVTTGGTSSDFVKGDGSLDGTSYQIAGNYITSLTGDGTASGPGSAVFTLANTAVIPSTYGSASQVPVLTVDSKGRITNVTSTAINYPAQLVLISGDASGAGLTGTSINLVFNTVNANPYAFITALKFSVNGKGLVTGASPLTNLDIFSIIGYTPLQDAPSNGTTYGRKNGLWVGVSSGGGGGTVTSVAVTSGTGISASVANPTTTPNITITNTAPDQTVVLNNGTGISVSGTYPNFTITNTSPSSGGTVTAVTASTPLASTGGTTPNITIQQASGSQAGYLSSTDWTTFNSKQDVISLTTTGTSGAATFIANTLNIPQYQAAGTYVTSVGATGPITSSGGTAPVISTSMATNKLIGRSTAGTGVMEEISVGTGLSLSGGTLSNSSPFTTPLTTKGDIYVRNSSADTRLPVGLDTQILIADSTAATGLKWGTNTAATPLGYYGAFQDVTNQTAAVINTGYPMLLGVTDLTNGVTVVSGSRVTIANTGIYNIQWSGQFTNPTAAEHDVTIWLRKNGVDVAGSAGIVLVPPKHGSSDGHTLPSWNFLLDVVAGDYYEFVWSTVNTSVYLSFTPAGSPPPSTASVVLTVTQQSGIMAGTGITAINSLTGAAQTLVAGTSGTDFAISSTGTTHTFNIPDASATARGLVTTGTQTIAGAKTFSTTPIFSALTAGSVPYIGTSGQVSQNNSNFFWDNTNARLGIGTTSPTAALTITGASQTGSSAIGVLDLTQTWNTSGNPTAIKLNVTATAVGNIATASLLDLQISGSSIFRVARNGYVYLTSGAVLQAGAAGNAGTISIANTALQFTTQSPNNNGTIFSFSGANGTIPTANSITNINSNLASTWSPTSGTATLTNLSLTGTVNQTGTATGIVRWLHINPTLTAAADFRGLEVTNGSIVLPYTAQTATYAIKTSDYLINVTSGTFTATLPTAVGCTGKNYIIKNSGAGAITVATTSSQTIDGSTTYSLLLQYKYVHVVSNGANWIIIANN